MARRFSPRHTHQADSPGPGGDGPRPERARSRSRTSLPAEHTLESARDKAMMLQPSKLTGECDRDHRTHADQACGTPSVVQRLGQVGPEVLDVLPKPRAEPQQPGRDAIALPPGPGLERRGDAPEAGGVLDQRQGGLDGEGLVSAGDVKGQQGPERARRSARPPRRAARGSARCAPGGVGGEAPGDGQLEPRWPPRRCARTAKAIFIPRSSERTPDRARRRCRWRCETRASRSWSPVAGAGDDPDERIVIGRRGSCWHCGAHSRPRIRAGAAGRG